jgi:hypothetical protein
MIKNFKSFNESFTNTIRSVKVFLDKVNIYNSEYFISELYEFCYKYDIPLSKIFGEYLNTKKTIKLLENTKRQLGIFRFNLKSYIGFYVYNGENIVYGYFNDVDFCIVVDIEAQEKGLKELTRKRSISKSDIQPIKNDNYYREKNLKRYREILYKKKIPSVAKTIVEEIIKNNTFSEIPKSIFAIKKYIPHDLLEEVLNLLLDYKSITKEDYYALSPKYKYY